MASTGLYIHIPFCKSRCIYCGFYSSTRLQWRARYVAALCQEMRLREAERRASAGAEADKLSLSTVYLGGGTPSQLSREQLDELFLNIYKVYDVSPSAEVTLECNPDDVCQESFYLPPQVNRVSMGVQSFDEGRLHFLHRRHSVAEVFTAVDRLRQRGISNLSIDLMFGFPGETLAEWEHDIDSAISIGAEHLSAYALMYEEGTPLYRLLKQHKVEEIDDELSLRMYDRLIDRLTLAGYEHYEISNFARLSDTVKDKQEAHGGVSPYRSQHNSSYWQDKPYIGIGAAAHSYDRKTRSWNVADLRLYIDAISHGERPFEQETIDESTHYDDLITTRLRTREGLDLSLLTPEYRGYLLAQAQSYIARGLLQLQGECISLTRKGIYISDEIMSDLMHV